MHVFEYQSVHPTPWWIFSDSRPQCPKSGHNYHQLLIWIMSLCTTAYKSWFLNCFRSLYFHNTVSCFCSCLEVFSVFLVYIDTFFCGWYLALYDHPGTIWVSILLVACHTCPDYKEHVCLVGWDNLVFDSSGVAKSSDQMLALIFSVSCCMTAQCNHKSVEICSRDMIGLYQGTAA